MNILLVSAATPETFWSYKHVLSFISKKAVFPPLGLLTVAAMLPREWNMKLIDLNVDRLTDDDIRWADYVMVSAMVVQAASAHEVFERCGQLGTPIIAGGPLFVTGHAAFPQTEHFVLCEAENIISELVADMESGQVKAVYESTERPDVGLTPIPRWDLLDMRNYALMSVQFSRGCPFNCEFCDIIVMNGRKPRVKSPSQMIAELDALVSAGWKHAVFIVDDNFIGNRVKVKAFLEQLIVWQERRSSAIQFSTEASLNVADDPELLSMLVRAGFKKLFIGLETPEEAALIECEKIQNTSRDMLAAVKTIQRAGLEVMGGFIVGFDSDHPNIFERQIKFIQEAGVVTAMVGLLHALPGTQLFSRLKSEGRLLQAASGNNVEAVLNFIPKLDRDVLIEGYRSLVKQLYTPRVYYHRILTFLREYRPQGPRFKFARWDLMAFIKSLWIMGVRGQGRREYWKFFTKTLLLYPRSFPEAMTLAIMGYHYRRIASSL